MKNKPNVLLSPPQRANPGSKTLSFPETLKKTIVCQHAKAKKSP